ncbi:MAG: OmpA family protein [Syntrophales bacterium]|nr:OmpA family protein [Syntrophales bacterium]
MKSFMKVAFMSLCVIALLGIAATSNAQRETIIEPRAENFVYYVDNSGSMAFDHEKAGMKKTEVARNVLMAINRDIPELDATFGVYTFGPYKEYRPASPFNREAMGGALSAIPTDIPIFDRMTPMGDGLKSLDTPLSGLKDRIAVIALADGESNWGSRPQGVMKDMYDRYGDRICFHFISLAQTPQEKAFIGDLAAINSCSVVADAGSLMEDAYRADFIERVFYTSREVAVTPAPTPVPVQVPAPTEEVIAFSNINFDFDKTEIKAEYREILREAARIINARPATKVTVKGYTCNIGPADYNMGLSERRAQAVADFLVREGVRRDRLDVMGYGLSNPTFTNDTRDGRALNRRVEMLLK